MLPKSLQPYAKALAPLLLAAAAAGVQWLITGQFGAAELATSLTGAASAVFVLLLRNRLDPAKLEVQVLVQLFRELQKVLDADDRLRQAVASAQLEGGPQPTMPAPRPANGDTDL